MFRVVEAFSGIGSQAKALEKLEIEHEIVATIDWDINAIIAYDIIHHGEPDLTIGKNMKIEEIKEKLCEYTMSYTGKAPITDKVIKKMKESVARRLYAAIIRSKNLVSITDVKGNQLENEIDLFTYSFPCQDLSIARAWHGENGGIDREANNRSGMLWEVERILKERQELKMKLPRFLLMENVSNILSKNHKANFEEWQAVLAGMGYYNVIYNLNALDFGIPQNRKRVFMISILSDKQEERRRVENYFIEHDLRNNIYTNTLNIEYKKLESILKTDYMNEKYRIEADNSQPNRTPSRKKIYIENTKLYDGSKVVFDSVKTLTTKQDRNPNSGVLDYFNNKEGKAKFRTLTTRECFLLMGFSEEDYDRLIEYNFEERKNKKFFTQEKLYRMAGNSIVVDILEQIFKQIIEVKNLCFKEITEN